MALSETQLTDVLVGLIKAQAAALQAIAPAEVIGLRVVPALQTAAGIPAHQPMSLSNWPARALLSAVTGNRIDTRPLQDLLQQVG